MVELWYTRTVSQVVKIHRMSFRGVPAYLGEHSGTPLYSGNPEKVASWLCDAFRTRFNQHRSQRSKYVYQDGKQLLDLNGEPLLTPIGSSVTLISDKEARQQFPHLAAVPSLVLQAPERLESTEWFAAIKRRKTVGGKLPGFRSRKRGDKRFSCWFNGGRNAVFRQTGRRSGMLVISGQNPSGVSRKGRWEIRFHVRVSQPIRDYTSVQVDLRSRKVLFVNAAPVVERSSANGVVGIDRGVVVTAATSDADMFTVPETPELDAKVVSLQKTLARKRRMNPNWKTSTRYRKARTACSNAQRVRASVKTDAIHAFTKRVARNYETVVVEALPVEKMSRRGKGSSKATLNRRLRDARWSTLLSQLAYKTGGNTVVVNPAYTSQRCSECGHIERENRESQAVFRCVECSHTDNADVNAAKNIRRLYFQGWAAPTSRTSKTTGTKVSVARSVKREPLVPSSH